MKRGSSRIFAYAAILLVYALCSRRVYLDLGAGVTDSNSWYWIAGSVLAVALFLVVSATGVKQGERSAIDLGLSVHAKAWYSVPILGIALILTLCGSWTGSDIPLSRLLASSVLLLASSVMLRAYLMRSISDLLGQRTEIAWPAIAITGVILAVVHPMRGVSLMTGVASHCFSSSIIAATGSVFAAFVLDVVWLLHPTIQQSAILVPVIGVIMYVILALAARFLQKTQHEPSVSETL